MVPGPALEGEVSLPGKIPWGEVDPTGHQDGGGPRRAAGGTGEFGCGRGVVGCLGQLLGWWWGD